MNLVRLNIETIQLGQPLPFVLRGEDGAMLANKGYVIRSPYELARLIERGRQLCVDTDESGDSHRAYLAQLQRMLIADNSLGEIATMKMVAGSMAESAGSDRGWPDWHQLQMRATQLLRAPAADEFLSRFHALYSELAAFSERSPDAMLLAMVYLSAQETRMYSATHSMLVACVCMVVAREMLHWPEEAVASVGKAALSMNIAMTDLQDQLVQQSQPLSTSQITAVEEHAARAEKMLMALGVQDPLWLEAVRGHHHRMPGAMDQKTLGQKMARLVQRADVFGARIAPRAARWPMPVTAAMQASYYDEDRQVDEVGAAVVKALGVYPPGAFVRLASQEVAVVVRRGNTGTTPRVAVVTNRDGMATGEPIPRDTSNPQWKITGVVAFKDVKVNLSLDRLLTLV